MAGCTIELLVTASKAAARSKYVDPSTDKLQLDSDAETYAKADSVKRRRFISIDTNLKEHGYVLHDGVIQESGADKPDITAVCLKPEPDDTRLPVVIAFKGTDFTNRSDLAQDASIATKGLAKEKAREEAWALYLKISGEFPGQEIVLTGHSLGGHFAQYVAARAYAEGYTGVFVRTFNSAPISVRHGSGLKEDKLNKLNHFVNYRTHSDPVSGTMTNMGRSLELYGDVYSFSTSEDTRWTHPGVDAHKADILNLSLSDDIKCLQVGSSKNMSCEQAYILEKLCVMSEAYDFRVKGEYFANYRSGVQDIKRFTLKLPAIEEDIKRGNYNDAMEKLSLLQREVDGKSPYRIVQSLIDELVLLQPDLARTPDEIPPEPSYTKYYKAVIVNVFRDNDDTYEQEDEDEDDDHNPGLK